MENKVRMADIAERLGISVVSVSKALSGKDGVSDQMREKIRRTAAEMGYTPLRIRTVRREKPKGGTIGILVPDRYFDDNTFYAGLYRQVSLQCNQHGYAAMLEIVTADAERNRSMPAMVQSHKVDGLIFLGEVWREYVKNVTSTGLPYVLLDFYDEQLPATSVTSDNISGGYHLANHLLACGYRDIGFVGSIHATSSIMDRFLGYAKALLMAGIAIRMDWVLEDRDENGNFEKIDMPQAMPRAFLCSCDEVAHNLIKQLKSAGYTIPQDIAIVGYDDFQIAQLSDPPLTTYRVNTEAMSSICVEKLVSAINGKPQMISNTVVKGRFVLRHST